MEFLVEVSINRGQVEWHEIQHLFQLVCIIEPAISIHLQAQICTVGGTFVNPGVKKDPQKKINSFVIFWPLDY